MTRQAIDNRECSLSPMSRDVLHLLGRGATTTQIAETLGLSLAEVDDQIVLLQTRFGAADQRSLRVRVIMAQGRE